MLTISGPVKITTPVTTLAQLAAFLELCTLAQVDPDAPLTVKTSLGGRLKQLTVEGDIATTPVQPPGHTTSIEPRYSPVGNRP